MLWNKEEVIRNIKQSCLSLGLDHPAQIAYTLATVQFETCGLFTPVRQSYWVSDIDSFNLQYYPETYPFYGRGYFPLKWKKNYEKLSIAVGVDLVSNPDLVLNHNIAKIVLIYSLRDGLITGKPLDIFINKNICSFKEARKTLVGLDNKCDVALLADIWLRKLDNNEL